jgi:hypothetical protein
MARKNKLTSNQVDQIKTLLIDHKIKEVALKFNVSNSLISQISKKFNLRKSPKKAGILFDKDEFLEDIKQERLKPIQIKNKYNISDFLINYYRKKFGLISKKNKIIKLETKKQKLINEINLKIKKIQ